MELRGRVGTASSSYIFFKILKVSIISPLQRLNRNVGKLRYLRRSTYCNLLHPWTNFVALFWTFSTSSINPTAWGDQTASAYYRWLLTNNLYNPINIFLSICFVKFLFITPNMLYALFTFSWMWQMFMKNKTKIASWMSDVKWAVIYFSKLLFKTNEDKFSFWGINSEDISSHPGRNLMKSVLKASNA